MDTYLGIDTSCYTTSLCLVDETYDIAADERIILTVPKGGRGLSQSNMVYQHTRNLPVLFERAAAVLKDRKIRAVAVTDQPRRRTIRICRPFWQASVMPGRSLRSCRYPYIA